MPKFLENWINGIQAWVQNNPKKRGRMVRLPWH